MESDQTERLAQALTLRDGTSGRPELMVAALPADGAGPILGRGRIWLIEGILTGFMALQGVSPSAGAAPAILYRGFNEVFMAGLGLFFLMRLPCSSGAMRPQASATSSMLTSAPCEARRRPKSPSGERLWAGPTGCIRQVLVPQADDRLTGDAPRGAPRIYGVTAT